LVPSRLEGRVGGGGGAHDKLLAVVFNPDIEVKIQVCHSCQSRGGLRLGGHGYNRSLKKIRFQNPQTTKRRYEKDGSKGKAARRRLPVRLRKKEEVKKWGHTGEERG